MEAIFQKEVEKLKTAGKAIILSSHILSEVEKLADRVAVIRKGEIVETGSLEDLRHLTRYQYKVITEEVPHDLEKLASVHDLQIIDREASFQADSDSIDEILKTLLQYEYINLNQLLQRLKTSLCVITSKGEAYETTIL